MEGPCEILENDLPGAHVDWSIPDHTLDSLNHLICYYVTFPVVSAEKPIDHIQKYSYHP